MGSGRNPCPEVTCASCTPMKMNNKKKKRNCVPRLVEVIGDEVTMCRVLLRQQRWFPKFSTRSRAPMGADTERSHLTGGRMRT